jgi:hypothetical protein
MPAITRSINNCFQHWSVSLSEVMLKSYSSSFLSSVFHIIFVPSTRVDTNYDIIAFFINFTAKILRME